MSVTPTDGSTALLAKSAERWLVPWALGAYPGRLRGVAQMLGVSRSVAVKALEGKVSRRSATKLAAEVRRRAAIGLAIADALEASLAARAPDRPRGLCIIGEDGLRTHQARRGRTGRRLRASAGEAVGEPVEASAPRSGERPV
jgi:hypothetical protein